MNLLLYQARGKPEEAERDVRALLDLMRDNAPVVQGLLYHSRNLLMEISRNLKTLDPEVGDPELVKSVEVQLAKLSSKLAE